jgi:xanthine/uracil permease
MYVTYYLDDDKNPQPILIHGQTGQLSGPRRASMKRAQRTALIIIGVATAIFILSLMLAIVSIFVQRLFPVAVIGLMVALIVGLLALVPIAMAWQFNRTNQ